LPAKDDEKSEYHTWKPMVCSEIAKTGSLDTPLAFFIRIWEGSMDLQGGLIGFYGRTRRTQNALRYC
jgi:hypothetical protein